MPFKKYLIPTIALFCLLPYVDPAMAILGGMLCAFILGNDYKDKTEKLAPKLLAICVVGLGGGMNLIDVLEVGAQGFVYTAIGITLTLSLGFALVKMLKVERQSGMLICAGTAICGGSAIAALAPAIQARSSAIVVSLAVVFMLNALALVVFPYVGYVFELSQQQFGLWSALAIHDTSSVIGAGLKYGEEALQTGTSVKLARALWIIPLVLMVQAFYKPEDNALKDGELAKRKYPWFILGFLAMAAIVTFVPALQSTGEAIYYGAQRGLILTLFLIGANMNVESLRAVGVRPFILGGLLWAIVSVGSLMAVSLGFAS